MGVYQGNSLILPHSIPAMSHDHTKTLMLVVILNILPCFLDLATYHYYTRMWLLGVTLYIHHNSLHRLYHLIPAMYYRYTRTCLLGVTLYIHRHFLHSIRSYSYCSRLNEHSRLSYLRNFRRLFAR